jgi:hypothetical protein
MNSGCEFCPRSLGSASLSSQLDAVAIIESFAVPQMDDEPMSDASEIASGDMWTYALGFSKPIEELDDLECYGRSGLSKEIDTSNR